MAIECKNENKPIDSPKIDAFVGKLQYVGIPPQHGIFIAATGYTTGAIERASAAGMRVLTMRGLTDEKLFGSIVGAFQSVIYLLLQVLNLTVTNEVPNSSIEAFRFYDQEGKLVAVLPDFIWQMWLSGNVPATLGDHEIDVPLPSNLHQMVKGQSVATFGLKAKVRVSGLAVTLQERLIQHKTPIFRRVCQVCCVSSLQSFHALSTSSEEKGNVPYLLLIELS